MSSPENDLGGTVAISVAHWREFSQSSAEWETHEYPLYTDAHFIAQAKDGLGPYQLINTVAGPGFIRGAPSAILRVRVPPEDDRLPDMRATDASRYHGGTLEDEVSALVALELGIRLKAGPLSRVFRLSSGSDPLGDPVEWSHLGRDRSTPVLEERRSRIPGLLGERDLGSCRRLRQLPRVPDKASTHLVKAARLHQEAVWICDVDPALSWLLLVSAVETAADQWRSEASPLERLRAWGKGPELERVLQKAGGEALTEEVARIIHESIGATKTFVEFLLEFGPSPVVPRPPEKFAIDWSPASLKKAFSKIYDYRSQALHGGTPFPYPMVDVPYQPGGGTLSEKPHFLASAYLGGVWQAEDVPMFLHVFHHIARGALLKWWDQLAPAAGENRVAGA